MALRATICLFALLLANLSYAEFKGAIPDSLPRMRVAYGDVIDDAFHRRFAECLEQQIGQEIEWQMLPTARLLIQLEREEIDLIFPMGFTPERNAYLQASDTVYVSHDYLIYYDKQTPDRPIENSVAVKRESPQDDYFSSQDTKVYRVDSYESLLEMVRLGRTEVAALPDAAFSHLLDLQRAQDIHWVPYLKREVGLYLFQSHPMTSLVNQAIEACKDDGPPSYTSLCQNDLPLRLKHFLPTDN